MKVSKLAEAALLAALLENAKAAGALVERGGNCYITVRGAPSDDSPYSAQRVMFYLDEKMARQVLHDIEVECQQHLEELGVETTE